MNRCPECHDPLLPGAMSCGCGWSDVPGEVARYPTLGDLQQDLATIIRDARRPPVGLPSDPLEAAKRWLEIIEKPLPHEAPRRHVKGDSATYAWAYSDRAQYTLKKFVRLQDRDQRIILAAREDGIFWRGDDMDFFHREIQETEEMRKVGKTEYRRLAIGKMKAAMRSLS